MDTTKIKEAYVELERLHNRIIQTEQQIQSIDLELDQTKASFNTYLDLNLSYLKPENTDE